MKYLFWTLGVIIWLIVFFACYLTDVGAMFTICPLLIIVPGICIALYIVKTSKYKNLNTKISELEKRIEVLEEGR